MAADMAWFRSHLIDDLLPRWLAACSDGTGLYLTHFDREWRRQPDDTGTVVSQARLLHNFSVGWAVARDQRYLDAVEKGAEFLRDQFIDTEYGGAFWSCRTDGTVVDDRKDAYGQAFCMFGLAHAYGATGDPSLRQAAERVWRTVRDRMLDDEGGLIPWMSRSFDRSAPTRSQNPIMHLFEALLAMAVQPALEHYLAEAEHIAAFVAARLIRQDGALPEVYSAAWKPLPEDEGGRIDLGHQFEWAWLLSRGVELGLPQRYLAVGRKLLDVGLTWGIDPSDGGVASVADLGGRARQDAKTWWPQCEAIRALMHWTRVRGERSLEPTFERLVDVTKARFLDHEYGGWFATVEPDGTVRGTEKGNHWKLDYHVVGMCAEADRLS